MTDQDSSTKSYSVYDSRKHDVSYHAETSRGSSNLPGSYEGFIIYPTYRIEGGKTYIYLFGRLKDGRSFCTKNKFRPYFFIKTKDLEKAFKIAKSEKIENFTSEDSSIKSFKEENLVRIYTELPKSVALLRKSFEETGIDCFEADIRFVYRFMMDLGLKGSVLIKEKQHTKKQDSGTEFTKEANVIQNQASMADVFFDEPQLESAGWKPKCDDFKILSIDIESSMDIKDLYCVSMHTNDKKLNKVLIVAPKTEKTDKKTKEIFHKEKFFKNAEVYETEKDLLLGFKKALQQYDPDIITGWNLIDFDLKILMDKMKKYGISFDLGRTEDQCSLKITDSFMSDSKADFQGRMVLDGIHLLKTSFIKLDDYKLGTAAKEFTGEKKLIADENKGEDIEKAYKHDTQKLIDYNLLDAKLSLEVIKKSGALDLTIQRSLMTGMTLDRVRASIASLDSLYLRQLRKRGYAAISSKFVERTERTTGGYVMKPKPGIYDYVIVCDFKSLYPSIMITFNIDPLMFRPEGKKIFKDEDLIKAPNGACFSKSTGILPEILIGLWKEREAAKKRNDELTRWAIKILMNSMYGVIASPNCRFYSFEMANAITSFGHMMIKTTSRLVEEKGFEVIYGDTDSVFINLDVENLKKAEQIGNEIQKNLNSYLEGMIRKDYGLQSFLELEFEKVFKKFLMPKVRGSEEGAKKRYAGLLEINGEEKLDFTGLEFVRRDWTELSKKFQLELLDLIFHEKEIASYVRKFVQDLKQGRYNELLVYRKALRKDVGDYTKTTPPHVKAARKLEKINSNIIDYVMTVEGPEPIQKIEHSIDYEHYIDKQIKPIADSVLGFFGQDFDSVVKGIEQKSLFSFGENQ